MKILLCGEGPAEVGVSNAWDDRNSQYVVYEGWMQPLIRATLKCGLEYVTQRRKDLQLSPSTRGVKKPLPPGHGEKAAIAKLKAAQGDFDAVVFMVDADSNDQRDWKHIVDEIEKGFARIQSSVVAIACVPMSASESWLLSDPAAWLMAFEYAEDGLPPNPESIWGKRDDPNGDHPHRYFARICRSSGVEDNYETRNRLANALSLVAARARCPISLDPFIKQLEACSPP